MDVKMLSIDSIGLSNRSKNALHRAEIHTVGDMLAHTEDSLNEIRNLGKKSIEEILVKIDEYRKLDEKKRDSGTDRIIAQEVAQEAASEEFEEWIKEDSRKEFVRAWLLEKKVKIRDLEFLSVRAFNILLFSDYDYLHQIVFMSEEELMKIPRMDFSSAGEIVRRCNYYLKNNSKAVMSSYKDTIEQIAESSQIASKPTVFELLKMAEYHDVILRYVKLNDKDIHYIGLSNRSFNRLLSSHMEKMSDLIFMTEAELLKIPAMGVGSVKEVMARIHDYLIENETRIISVCNGDDTALLDDNSVWNMILEAYNKLGFGGLSLREMRDNAVVPEQLSDERLKAILGRLIAEGKLEYVDFRCYRVYPRFTDYLIGSAVINDRNKEIISRRLQGETLETISSDYGMTRERVRQIVSKDIKKARRNYSADTGMIWADEDYYRYFFENYAFDKKDAEEWLGVNRTIYNYLELTGSKQGKKDLEEALDDNHNLDLGFRLKIKNYLNRNKLYLDGRWIDKKRAALEEYVVRKFCRENVLYDEFIHIYNDFLQKEDVPYDEDIYYTDAVIRTRENKLTGDRFLLWKQNKLIRYYDIDGQDFSELLDTLNLDAYENIEYSTWKFMQDYPEIMEKYDIRDQYELHNLLRKIVKDGEYHDFHCERMPMVRFGTFDRDSALFDLLIDNAPISQVDFAELVHQEYGYDPATVIGTYLQPFSTFYHQGMYVIDQKAMLSTDQKALLAELSEDFYYIDEIRRIYKKVASGANLEEINPYNLKLMGFSVLSRYVYRNHDSLDAYFRYLLTKEDITDITPYRRKFAYIVSFSSTLVNMKNNLEILEFEPNQIITFRKLEAGGITKEDLKAFCDEVADFVEEGTYFSVQSIKRDGFVSDLFDLGFSDWFYASLLTSDDRFRNTRAFGNIILFKGDVRISIQSFEESLIREHGSIDVYDLMTEMEEIYGCRITDRLDLIYKVGGTDVYYDKYTDRLYANEGVYNRELDAAEGM